MLEKMDADKFLAENKERYEIIESLQDLLNHITDDSYEETLRYIEENKNFFLNTRENVILFLWNINTFTIYNFKKMEILLDIIIHFEKEIKSIVDEEEIIDIVDSLLCGVYYLYDKGFYSIKTIVHKSTEDTRIFVYFYPEIDEYDHELAENEKGNLFECNYYNVQELKTFLEFVINNIDQHKENRKQYHNPMSLHKSIREDDIKEFQSILSKNNYDYNYNFEFSFYERTLTENPTPSLIQIAATYGSVHIFKFLWMQKDIDFDDNLICYAISGRNYDIIHICEEKCSRKRALMFSINSHQHELTDYFIDLIENDENEEKLNGYEIDEDNIYDILNIKLLQIAYQSANYHVVLPYLKKIVYNLDYVENNMKDSSYCTFLRKPILDIDLFKFIYSHKNDNINIYNGTYPIYLQWISAGMTDGIKYVLHFLKPPEFYNFFRAAFTRNLRIAGVILDFALENQNLENAAKAVDYFKQNFDFRFFLKACKTFNEDFVEKVLKFDIKISEPEVFVDCLINETSRKFINALFKKKLNFGVDKELIADILTKNQLIEEAGYLLESN